MGATQHILNDHSYEDGFFIIEEFAALSANRKMNICYLAEQGDQKAFTNAVHFLWPHADAIDVKKLESFALLVSTLYSTKH